jgi:nucleoside-diphosphate-sugar epimerase
MPPVANLVTGVGYIGAPLVRRLLERGERVLAFDNFSSTPRDAIANALPPEIQLIEGDVAEPSHVARAFDAATRGHDDEPLTVYHLAAQPSAAVAARDPEQTERSNLVGARVVLEAARDRAARVVFGGSFRVYGDELAGHHVDESTPYGRVADLSHLSKVYVEQLARMIGVAFVSVRLGVTYGRSPIMKTEPHFMTVPNLFCQRAANGDVLQVLEDRPMAFIHIDDAVEALLVAANRLATGSPAWEALNAAPEVATIGQIALTVQRIANARGRWVRVHGASGAATFSVASKLDATGARPHRTLEDGLPHVLAYFLEQSATMSRASGSA